MNNYIFKRKTFSWHFMDRCLLTLFFKSVKNKIKYNNKKLKKSALMPILLLLLLIIIIIKIIIIKNWIYL